VPVPGTSRYANQSSNSTKRIAGKLLEVLLAILSAAGRELQKSGKKNL
jgi:hypothetical protein